MSHRKVMVMNVEEFELRLQLGRERERERETEVLTYLQKKRWYSSDLNRERSLEFRESDGIDGW